ncbi:MAG: hypothetical protein ACJ8FY_19805 [Gemmataceae bacterium]
MSSLLLALTITAFSAGDGPGEKTERERNPFAPSLPLLTEKEEEKLDAIIDRFIDSDIGKLRGDEAKIARRDFEKLGSEASFALIRGLNKAASIEHSCPVVTIARKLAKIFESSADTELLQFARENIGAEVGPTRHANVLRNLRLTCSLRKGALARQGITSIAEPEVKTLKARSLSELVETATTQQGAKQKEALRELGKEKGDDAIEALAAVAATAYEGEVVQIARDELGRCLARLTSEELRGKLKDSKDGIRLAAARLMGRKPRKWGSELISMLEDENAAVRDEVHKALVQLNKGKDLGPASGADAKDQAAAVAKWKEWWKEEIK